MRSSESSEGSLLSISKRSMFEGDKVKGSRFIAVIAPTKTVDESKALADELKTQHAGASHVCWAFRGEGRDDHRWSDDGEPNGSAGRPILQVVEGAGLSWVTVAVVRYFGGSKLGTGGLARAYSDAAKEVVSCAETTLLLERVDLKVTVDYPFEGGAQRLFDSLGVELTEAQYGAQVEFSVTLLASQDSELSDALVELTRGSVSIERSGVYLGG